MSRYLPDQRKAPPSLENQSAIQVFSSHFQSGCPLFNVVRPLRGHLFGVDQPHDRVILDLLLDLRGLGGGVAKDVVNELWASTDLVLTQDMSVRIQLHLLSASVAP